MNGDADGRSRTVAGDLGNGLGAVGAELVVHINEDGLEVLRGLVDHGGTIVGEVGIDALAVFVQLHVLIERMTDGLHHRAVHLAQGDLGVNGRAGILQSVELLHLDLAGLHIHRHLSKMRAVGHGGCRGDKAAVGNGLAPAAAAGGGMHQLIVREGRAGGLGVYLARSPDVQVLHLLLQLQGSFLQNQFLQLRSGNQGCVAAEEGAGGSIRAGIKGAGIRIAGNHGDAVHRQLQHLRHDLGGDGVQAGAQVGAAAVEDDGAVSLQLGDGLGVIQARQARALHDHGKALADLPVRIIGHFLLAPVDHVAALLNGLVQAAGAHRHHRALAALAQALEDLQHVALFHVVFLHHGAVVDAQLVSQLRHGHHDAIGTLGRAVALISAGRGRIGVVHLQVIGHVVHLEQGHGLGAAVHGHRQAVVAVGAGVGTDLHEQGGDGAVLLAAHLHVDAHGVPGGVGIELLSPGVAVIHGFLGDPGGVAGKLLHQDILLGAVAAAHTLFDDVDLIFRDPADPANDAPHMVGHLGGAVEHQPAALHMGIAHMGLQGGVLDLAGLIGLLHDGVRLGKALLHVADTALIGRGDVLVDVGVQGELIDHLALPGVALELVVLLQVVGRAGIILHGAVVDQGRAGGHGLLHGEHRVRGFVLHLNEGSGLVGNLRRPGHDARHTVAHMANLHVEQTAVVGGRLGSALPGLHIVHIRAVESGDDGGHTVQLLRLAGVDGLDIGAGKGAAQHVQAPGVGRNLILHKYRLAGDQGRAVDLPGGLADDVQLGAEGRRDLRLEFALVPQLAGQLHSQVIVLIARVADENAGEHVLDLRPGGVGVFFQQPGQNQRRRRSIIGALYDARGHHGLLHIVQFALFQQRLRRFDLGALRLIEQDKIGILQLTVKNNGVGPGKAFGIVAVADGVAPGVVQHIPQAIRSLAAQDNILTVESAFYFHLPYLPSVNTIFARYFL